MKNSKPIAVDTQIYLSGPMTGIPGWNAKAFLAAAKVLRRDGFTVFDPSETDLGIDQCTPEAPAEGAWNEFLRFDIVALMKCEVVFVLPGWRSSKVASLEVLIAEAVGMAVYEYRSRNHIRETILQEADRIVSGDRQRSYGHPLEDFTRTGEFWYPILKDLGLKGPIPAERVGLMMIALKMSREINNPNRDNRVDMGGYTKTLDLIAIRRKGQKK